MRVAAGLVMAGLAVVLTACNDDKTDATPPPSAPPSATSPAPASPGPASAPTSAATSAAASAPVSAPPKTTAPAGDGTAKTRDGAIARYEAFLHAVGREDLAIVCDIAGPAAKQAENEGMGPCTKTMPMMFSMISPAQKQALRTATVDPAKVTMSGTARADIPARAIKASVTFTSDDLGDVTLEYRNGNWYVVD